MSAELPGNKPVATPPPPCIAAVQPPPERSAQLQAQWSAMANIRPALSELIAVLDRHPELIEWARGSDAGTVRITHKP